MSEEKCPHCGASLKSYWHKITPGLVQTLVKVYTAVNAKGENRVHKRDLTLSHSEYGNFQKLRFHGLIAKMKEDGIWKSGDWLITKRGAQFVRGEINIPAKVKTFRNRVVGHSEEMIDIRGAISTKPHFETEFQFDFIDIPENEDYDSGPILKPKKRKKGKPTCPTCSGPLFRKTETKPHPTDYNAVIIIRQYMYCPKCHKEVAA